ncbi:DUF5377 family protein [Actinobacillus pleuropneumoniae]|uniref:Dithiol-disulfide isomerase n=5 Tax=Actinobacillus pleuropneumoniae TaxID=715 RepID=A3N3A2_ACTP2|nr:DUF5377 family protein [Actinobacillus pleuropneumoniae]ABN74888.1 hypothetical protein APL_1804 [Actinobacillus pleuropneumoniae serovar 5b str. L20]ABY70390.1 hypothetical protein APJL_1840 [Actinobacillus pleuropneumoniae serovar 3 str. JL03]ASU15654.1 hypothetical protein CHY23_00886 [Actinobacillus pleuropneumoniae]AWG96214.1 dithiol-disulfide isomerase [Actinobacillus pleuropneumoniae serovar 1 str. 4074]AXA22284.1 dithiol-disulfide isomerase [Actinobacillus pleuropneumoniae]
MSVKTEVLFSNHWNVRVSDPGEEGNVNHFFETVFITLEAKIGGSQVQYEFTRKVEDDIKIQRSFTDVNELFEFLGDYLSPVALGNVGVRIGQLNLA